MTTVDRVKMLCKERKVPISKLEKSLGFGNGYIGQLKKGVFPDDRLKKIAEFFGVSVNYLTGDSPYRTKEEMFNSWSDAYDEEKISKDSRNLTNRDKNDIAKDLNTILEKLNDADGFASFEGEEIPAEDIELFAGQLELMLTRLKKINKEKYNPYKNNNGGNNERIRKEDKKDY